MSITGGWDGIWMLLGVLVLLLALGVRVAYVLLAVGVIGTTWVLDPAQSLATGKEMWGSIRSYSLTAIPMFVFMAEILLRTDVTKQAYKGLAALLAALPGGAAYASITGSTIFAAISGSSVANAACLGVVAGPAMVDLGYSRRLTFGTIAAGGTLGILIPPSTAMIIYGCLTGVSVGKLFLGGIVPGIVGALLFAVVVLIWSLLKPADAPRSRNSSRDDLIEGAIALLPLLLLIGVVLGGIYLGIFTPTEAGGLGVAGAIVVAAFWKKLSFRMLWEAAEATTSLTCMILLIIAGAGGVTYILGMTSLAAALTSWIVDMGLSVTTLLVVVAIIYIVLGCFVESVSLIVLTIPVIYPIMVNMGVNGVWFGIYTVILIEIGLITPPVGLNLFVLERIPAGQTFMDIAIGSFPFVIALCILLGLIVVFPPIVTWLPLAGC